MIPVARPRACPGALVLALLLATGCGDDGRGRAPDASAPPTMPAPPPADASCRCVGDVADGRLDLACGASTCLNGTGYRCTGPNRADYAPEACGSTDAAVAPPSADSDARVHPLPPPAEPVDAGMGRSCEERIDEPFPPDLAPRCFAGTRSCLEACWQGATDGETYAACWEGCLAADELAPYDGGDFELACRHCVNYQNGHCMFAAGCGDELVAYQCCVEEQCGSGSDADCPTRRCGAAADAVRRCIPEHCWQIDSPVYDVCFSEEYAECTPGESRSCYGGPPATEGMGACRAGSESCDATGHWTGECAGERLPASTEGCFDGTDDDCDGAIDEGCGECAPGTTRTCYSGSSETRDVGACRSGTQTCDASSQWAAECVGERLPASDDTCHDGVDGDCDGEVDEGCPCLPQCSGRQCGPDGCGGSCGSCTGDEACTSSGRCEVPQCDPVHQTLCGSGDKCTWTGSRFDCLPDGTTTLGSPCTTDTCVAGTMCASDGSQSVCRAFCRSDYDCDDGECVYRISGTSTRLCSRACDPVAGSGCSWGEGCYLMNIGTAQEVTDCRDEGWGTAGSSCGDPHDCASGHTCISGQCRRVCDLWSSCASGDCQSVSGWSTYGVCPF